MKNVFVLGLVAAALIFSACNKNSDITSPTGSTSTTFMKAADQLNLTNEQLGVLDEMYYLGEDMSVILTPAQLNSFNIVLSKLEPTILGGDPTLNPRGFADMAALQYYNLILKANPEMDQATKDALKQLLQESAQKRADIIKNNQGDPTTMKQLLQDEHNALMEAMKALLTPEQIQAVVDLQTKIEQERQAKQEQLLERRVQAQVQMMTKILGLTPEQATQIHDLLIAQAKEVDALRLQYKGNPEGFRAALKELQTKTDAAIYLLLTPDQQAKWDAWKKGGVINPKTTDPVQMQVEQLTKILQLTADQVPQLTKILQAQLDQKKLLMEKFKDDPAGLRQALTDLQKETDAAIVALLTPEQLVLWNKMHGKGDPGNGGTTGDPIQRQVDELTKMLGLTTDQAAKVYEIFKTQDTDNQAIFQQYKDDPAGLKQALTEEQAKISPMMKDVLTPDQYEKWLKGVRIPGSIGGGRKG